MWLQASLRRDVSIDTIHILQQQEQQHSIHQTHHEWPSHTSAVTPSDQAHHPSVQAHTEFFSIEEASSDLSISLPTMFNFRHREAPARD